MQQGMVRCSRGDEDGGKREMREKCRVEVRAADGFKWSSNELQIRCIDRRGAVNAGEHKRNRTSKHKQV